MLQDFDDPQTGLPGRAEVCVVGTGAAGILLATELARAGRRVLLLEGGGLRLEARSQELYRSEVGEQPHLGVQDGRFRTYGGSTTRWGGQILELDAEDFGVRPHVPGSGWPFPKATLTPFYERALRFEGLGGVEREDGRVWRILGLTPPEVGAEFCQSFSRWCPERDFAVLHGRELAELPNLTVLTHASVVGLELEESGGAVRSVRVRGFSGREASMRAATFVLALGGIETVRLLLQPMAEATAPWQQNGMLGRHFQDHIALNGIPLDGLRVPQPWRSFGYVTAHGFRYHNKLRLRPERQMALGTLNVAATLGPLLEDTAGRDRAEVLLREMVRGNRRPGVAEAVGVARHLPGMVSSRMAQRWWGEAPAWRRVGLTLHCEQAPLSASRISLTGERDALGLLRTRLDWRIGDAELHTLRVALRAVRAGFHESGVGGVAAAEGLFADDGSLRALCVDSNHHMGGVRMAASSAEGVVDADLRLHGVGNAYVCSSAVFPSVGFSNPTHTLLALGMRLADRLAGDSGSSGMVGVGRKVAGGMREVSLPGTTRRVPQLGFGCAYLLGPGLDHNRSLRLLECAYAAGIRHFDVARLYGQGHTEALLGGFLRTHTDASVTTKYGVVPPSVWQRAYAAGARRVGMPAPRRNDKASFTSKDAAISLHRSLRALGRDHVALFLLHEPTVEDLKDDELFVFLCREREKGTIGNFGIGGEYGRVPGLLRERPEYAPVLQFEHSVLGPRLEVPPERCLFYRSFAGVARELHGRLALRPAMRDVWSGIVQVELQDAAVLGELLLKAALEQAPGTPVLFSSTTEAHIERNVGVAGSDAFALPAQRLMDLLRENDLGTGEALYGKEAMGRV